MAGIGALAHIGLAKETTFGTPVAATAYLPFETESITAEIEQVVDSSLKALLDESPSYGGLETYGGEIVFPVRPTSVGHILRAAMGEPTTTGTNPYTHTFIPKQAEFSADCFLPPYTIEVHRDLSSAFQYAGCVVNSLQLSYGAKQKILKAQAEIIAKDVALITKSTPSFETNDPFLWHQAVLQVGGANNNIFEEFSVKLNNNLEGVATLNNTKKIAKIWPTGVRTVEVDATIGIYDLTEYNRFVNQSETNFTITFTSGSFQFKIELPKVRYTAFPLSVGGPDRLTVKLKGKAKYDATTTGAIKITLVNNTASY